MYYLSQQNTNKPDEMSEFLSDMLRTFLTAENLKSADSVYRKLVNILDTDISAFDFTSNKPKLESIIDDLKVEIVRKS